MTGERFARFSKAAIVRTEGHKDKEIANAPCQCISAGASGTTTAVIRGVLS